MKQACLKRVLCYACCLSLVLGVFAYKPAKAEAVFVSPLAALGASLIASVVVGTTATFFVESGAADDIGEAIDFLLEEYISVMDELTTYTPQDICEIVGNGASMLENGVIQLSSHAGNLMAGFINWLQNIKGVSDTDVPVLLPVDGGFYVCPSYSSLNFPPLPSLSYPYVLIYRNNNGAICLLAFDGLYEAYYDESGFFLMGDECSIYALSGTAWSYYSSQSGFGLDSSYMQSRFPIWTNFNVHSDAGSTLYWLGDGCEVDASLPTDCVTLNPKSSLQTIPNILPDQSSLLIALPVSGLDLSDQQGLLICS